MNISWIMNELLGVSGKNKNIKIAEVTDVTVAASGNATVISDFSLSDYPYHYVAVKADSSHNFIVCEQSKIGSISFPYPAVTLIDYSVTPNNRGITDWQKAKGETVRIDIENLDT